MASPGPSRNPNRIRINNAPLAGAQQRGRPDRGWLLAALGVALLALLFRSLVPTWVLADSPHDDQLFVRLGSSLSDGDWLGPFTNVTLVKGPAFPAFLGAAWVLHVPPLLLVQLLHVIASGVVGLALARATGSRAWGFWIYVALALDPAQYGASASRISREAWYGGWSLLLLGLLALIALAAKNRAHLTPRQAVRPVLVWGVLLGGALSVYWLSREERVWLLPSMGVLVVAALVTGRRGRPPTSPDTSLWRRGLAGWVPTLAIMVVAGICLQASTALVRGINDRQYGAPLVTDLVEGEFAETYTAWQSVLAGTDRRFVPISRAQREAVYAISPAAREMQPHLEGPLDDAWAVHGCNTVQVCDDVAAGWIPFAMRDAMVAAGHYATAEAAQTYLRTITEDIDRACAAGQLRCAPHMPALLPRPPLIDEGAVVRSARDSLRFLLNFDLAEQERPPSGGSLKSWQVFAQGVRGISPTPQDALIEESFSLQRAKRLEVVQWVYAKATVVLFPFALLGLLLLAVRRRRTAGIALAIGLAALVTVAMRVLLLALVNATSFPATKSAYALPATSPLVLLLGIGTWGLITTLLPVARARLSAASHARTAS